MKGIFFHAYDIKFTLRQKQAIRNWILSAVVEHNASCREVNFIFCSDEKIRSINKESLDHDYYTDIITFDLRSDKGPLIADIYISIDRVKDNAQMLGLDFEEELCRVMIHGILHLLGYNDKTDQEKEQMTNKENELLLKRDAIVPRGTI